MTRNYMVNWRANRKLAKLECECGNVPRLAHDKGCERCEEMDRARYRAERSIDIVRRTLVRFDLVSLAELAVVCGLTERKMRNAMSSLIESGEVEVVGASTATEYRIRRAV